ncbi:MAG: acetylglutamate kinase [Dehalococcoidales bacterium]|nr:acetylglutamate kinase [Dehalococcoidales bacterium]
MKDITVIKIGGSTFNSGDTTIQDVVELQKKKHAIVVVHGGGNTATEWLKQYGIQTKFVRGERATDIRSLAVVTAVLAGLVNKELSAAINLYGGSAVGISGVDGAMIESKMKDKELGYVGSVEQVNVKVLETLLKDGFIPVVSPISLYSLERMGEEPGIINVNGDPIAGEIAAALKAKRLIYLTDTDGIWDKNGATLSYISQVEVAPLITSGVIEGGMIPKVEACIKALKEGTLARIIDGRKPHALMAEFVKPEGGTTIGK